MGRRARSVMVVTVIAMVTLVLAGCAQTGTPSTLVDGWISTSGGGAAIGQVEVDSRNIDLAISDHDPSSPLKTVCALLTTDAQTAIGNLPTPDNTLTDDLNNAYEEAAAAGNDCYNGATGSAALLRRSAAERAKLVPMLNTALERIGTITGHTPSTSTTLAPNDSGDPFAPGVVVGR